MCGIIGAFDPHPLISDQNFIRLRDLMTHRGPDDCGFYRDPDLPVLLGHRRLSIIDLTPQGRQPMSDAQGNLWLTFNGEIYNFRELRKELEGAGYAFHSHTDSEVILAGYSRWGEAVVEKLRGMFAFAIYNRKNHQIFLARDRTGIKPLFYCETAKGFAFASEPAPLAASPWAGHRYDATAVIDAAVFGYIRAPKTIWRDIRRLPAGHTATYDIKLRRLHIRPYWDFDFSPSDDFRQAGSIDEILFENLKDAVASHRISDVPLGAFLSGGIDSSLVTAAMAALSKSPVISVSIGFNEAKFNELPLARALAAKYGTHHYEEIVTAEDLSARLKEATGYFGEPITDPSAIPLDFLCKLAKRHMTVALSGDGGDELFAGYRRYLKMHYLYLLQRIPGWRRIARGVGALRSFWRRERTFLQESSLSQAVAYASARSKMSWQAAQRLLSPEILEQAPGYDPYDHDQELFRKGLERGFDLWGCMRYIDCKTWLPEDVLAKVDAVSMRHSLEVRVPFLDHQFIEGIQRLPSQALVGYGGLFPHLKYRLKRIAAPFLTPAHLTAPKRGFALPIQEWFRDPAFCNRTVFSSEGSRKRPLFLDSELKILAELHREKKRNFHEALWVAWVLENWHQGAPSGE